jgi:hypothetical protein
MDDERTKPIWRPFAVTGTPPSRTVAGEVADDCEDTSQRF